MDEMKVKICGITNAKDAIKAAELGADFIGFNFYAKSQRKLSPLQAKEINEDIYRRVKTVGVFVNEEAAKINTIAKYCGLNMVQLHGDETPDFCEQVNFPIIKAFRVEDSGVFKQVPLFDVDYFLFDGFSQHGYGGTGKQIAGEFMSQIKELSQHKRVFVSGGLTPENVHKVVEQVQPFAVDVASGVEINPGLKSIEKMAAFIREAKA